MTLPTTTTPPHVSVAWITSIIRSSVAQRCHMNDAAYERWLGNFVMFGGEAFTKEEWEYHPNNPKRKRRRPGKPKNSDGRWSAEAILRELGEL
jgi:hypothetical protein